MRSRVLYPSPASGCELANKWAWRFAFRTCCTIASGTPLLVTSRRTMGLFDLRGKSGDVLADHTWMTETAEFDHLKLTGGERVEFYARVREYTRADGSTDYGLVDVMYAKVKPA